MQKVIHHKGGNTVTVILGDAGNVHNYVSQIDLIMTSPPYADARKKHYTSIKPDDYAAWFSRFSGPFSQCLRQEGSMIINIKDKVVKGVRSRYVWQTMLKLESLGWQPIEDYIWHKSRSIPGKWPNRFRDAWEYCFHLALTNRPYFDHDAAKRPAKRLDKQNKDHTSVAGFEVVRAALGGRKYALPDNVISSPPACVVGNKHPAIYPQALPAFFIPFLSPPNGTVLDPFAGSGTTAIAALALGRNCVLVEKEQKYFDLINDRLYSL